MGGNEKKASNIEKAFLASEIVDLNNTRKLVSYEMRLISIFNTGTFCLVPKIDKFFDNKISICNLFSAKFTE